MSFLLTLLLLLPPYTKRPNSLSGTAGMPDLGQVALKFQNHFPLKCLRRLLSSKFDEAPFYQK